MSTEPTHDDESANPEAPTFGPYDNSNPPPLDFEAWAALSASLLERDTEAQLDIFEERDIDPYEFDACNTFWLQQLASQCAHSNFGLASRYGKLCAEELSKRAPQQAAADAAAAAEDVDQTAFMTKLHDDTALPFKASELAAGAKPAVAPDTAETAPHDESGETQFLEKAPFPDEALPFDDKTDAQKK